MLKAAKQKSSPPPASFQYFFLLFRLKWRGCNRLNRATVSVINNPESSLSDDRVWRIYNKTMKINSNILCKSWTTTGKITLLVGDEFLIWILQLILWIFFYKFHPLSHAIRFYLASMCNMSCKIRMRYSSYKKNIFFYGRSQFAEDIAVDLYFFFTHRLNSVLRETALSTISNTNSCSIKAISARSIQPE